MKNKYVIALAILCLTLGWGESIPAQEGKERAQAVFDNVTSNFNSADALKNKLMNPLLGGGRMTTLDGQTELDTSIMCQGQQPYLTIGGQVVEGGDIVLAVDYHPELTQSTITLTLPAVSGYCSNGFVSCDSGTFSNCEYYQWVADQSGLRAQQLIGSDTSQLKGCNCLNGSCLPDPQTKLMEHLDRLSSGIIDALQTQQSRFLISQVEKQAGVIRVFGQDIQQCYSGSPDASHDLTYYYQNPQALSFAGNVAAVDHDLFNQLKESPAFAQLDTGNTVTCSIRRNIQIEHANQPRQVSVKVGPFQGKHVCRYTLNGDFQCDPQSNAPAPNVEVAPTWNANSVCTDSTNLTLADQTYPAQVKVRHLEMPDCSNQLQGLVEVDATESTQSAKVHLKFTAEECSVNEEIINQCEALAQNPACVLQYENVDGTSTLPLQELMDNSLPTVNQTCTETDSTTHYQIEPTATSIQLSNLLPGRYQFQMYTVDTDGLQSEPSPTVEFTTTSTSTEVRWLHPEEREDGSDLPFKEIQNYILVLTHMDHQSQCDTPIQPELSSENQCELGSTHQVSNIKIEPDSIKHQLENMIPGLYRLQMYTVDIQGLESPLSEPLDVRVQSPSAILNWTPPTAKTDGSVLTLEEIDHYVLVMTLVIESCSEMELELTGTIRTLGEGVCEMNVEADFFEKVQVYQCGEEQQQNAPAMADFQEPSADGVIRINQPDGSVHNVDVSAYLPQAQECVQSCKVRTTTFDTSSNQTGVPAMLRGDRTRGDDVLKACTADGVCPLEPGETQLSQCACTDSFAEAATSLQMLRLAGKDLECSYPGQSVEECVGNIEVFRGRYASCRTHGVQTRFENCCDLGGRVFEDAYTHPANQYKDGANSMANLFDMLVGKDTSKLREALNGFAEHTNVTFIQAGIEEDIMNWLLSPCAADSGSAALISSDMCIFIGEQCVEEWDYGLDDVCVQHADFHCCFKTQLARILHQQARPQFPGWNFGSPQAPQCQGFTLEQFQAIDFSKIDLSELHDSIKTESREVIDQHIQQNLNEFRSGLQ